MRGRWGWLLLCWVSLFLTFLCWNGSLGIWEQISARPDTADLRFGTAQFTQDDIRNMRKIEEERTEGSPVSVTAWYQSGKAGVSGNGNQESVQVVQLDGSAETLFSGALSSGQWLGEEDPEGCMLSEDIAYSLFGSTRVDGLTVEVDGIPYQIRGVLGQVRETLLRNNREDEERVFTSLTLKGNGEGGKRMAESFSMRQSVPSDSAIVTQSYIAGLAGLISSITVLVVMIAALVHLAVAAWNARANTALFLLWGALFLLSAAAFVWMGGLQMTFPDSLIPSRWSDFEFWTASFNRMGTELKEFFLMEKLKPDEVGWSLLGKEILYSVGMALSILAAVWSGRRVSLPVKEIGCVVLAFAAVLACKAWGLPAAANQAYWFFLPLCFWLWDLGKESRVETEI